MEAGGLALVTAQLQTDQHAQRQGQTQTGAESQPAGFVVAIEQQIDELTRLYGNFQDSETWTPAAEGNGESLIVSKVFDNVDFGFRQITIERPLRLNFQASRERIERLREITAFQSLAKSRKKNKKQAAAEEAADQAAVLATDGLGEVIWSSPFRPTIVGTDTYTDQLW